MPTLPLFQENAMSLTLNPPRAAAMPPRAAATVVLTSIVLSVAASLAVAPRSPSPAVVAAIPVSPPVVAGSRGDTSVPDAATVLRDRAEAEEALAPTF
jgi:hypothetical protein